MQKLKYKKYVFVTLLIVFLALIGWAWMKPQHKPADIIYDDAPPFGKHSSQKPVTYNVFNKGEAEIEKNTVKNHDPRQEWHVRKYIPESKPAPDTAIMSAQAQELQIQKQNTVENKPVNNPQQGFWDNLWGLVPGTHTSNETTQNQSVYDDKLNLNLHTYGNTLGRIIKKHIMQMGDQPQKMQAFILNRQSESAKKDLTLLANEYSDLANELRSITPPDEFKQQQSELINVYDEVSKQIKLLLTSESDADTVAKIQKYNSVVEEFAKRYLAIVNLFGAYGIKFNKGESGDIFIPTM